MDQPLTALARFAPVLGSPEKLAEIEAAIRDESSLNAIETDGLSC